MQQLSNTPFGDMDGIVRAASGSDRHFVESVAFQLMKSRQLEGKEAAAEGHRKTLRALVADREPLIDTLNFPSAILQLVRKEFARIEKSVKKYPAEYFSVENHALRCDYRIACFGRIPGGVEHIELGGFPGVLALRKNGRQLIPFLRCYWEARSRKNFYVMHVKHGIKPWTFLMVYSLEAQTGLFLNVADALRMNPDIHGLTATSWWFDPALGEVSPHMSFLRRTMEDGGAFVFFYRDSSELALQNSDLRAKLHAEGKYSPSEYTVVWPRRSLLAWADDMRKRQQLA